MIPTERRKKKSRRRRRITRVRPWDCNTAMKRGFRRRKGRRRRRKEGPRSLVIGDEEGVGDLERRWWERGFSLPAAALKPATSLFRNASLALLRSGSLAGDRKMP